MQLEKINEMDMYPQVVDYFPKDDFEFFEEVPFYKRRADIVIKHKGTGDLIAIEMKIKDWKRAFRQAMVYQLFANFCYVGIWHKYSHLVDIKTFNKQGIGILSINGTCEEILSPKKSRITKEVYSNEIKNRLERVKVIKNREEK